MCYSFFFFPVLLQKIGPGQSCIPPLQSSVYVFQVSEEDQLTSLPAEDSLSVGSASAGLNINSDQPDEPYGACQFGLKVELGSHHENQQVPKCKS